MVTSPDNTRVGPPPPAPSLIDGQGVVWSIRSDLYALRDGVATNGKASVILWFGGVIYVKAPSDGYWWQWLGNNAWKRLSLVDPSTGVPPPVVDVKINMGVGEIVSTADAASVSVTTLPPPPATFVPTVHKVPLNLNRIVVFDSHYWSGSAYSRALVHVCHVNDDFSMGFGLTQYATAPNKFSYPKYALHMGDGINEGPEVATFTAAPGTVRAGTFAGKIGALPDGPYMLSIVPYDSNGARVTDTSLECYVPFWVWVDKNGTAKNHPDVIFQNGSFDWIHFDGPNYFWARVPKTYVKPRHTPLKWFNMPTKDIEVNAALPHTFPGGEPFNTAVPRAQITRINWAITADAETMTPWWPQITSRGITVTENLQAYSVYDFAATYPILPMCDGPRGQAIVTNPMAIWVGHAGSFYGMSGHSFWKFDQTGTKTTFAGMRHPFPPPYWKEYGNGVLHPKTEILGDWHPSIPMNRRWPWESWGLVVDMRTTKQDYDVPRVDLPPFGLLPPHLGEGPVFYSTCRFGRVLDYQFHKARPTDPPTITELISGLNDPWGLAINGSILYIAVRQEHRIIAFNLDTGTYTDLISNPNGDVFGHMEDKDGLLRRAQLYDTTDAGYARARQEPIMFPEGLAYMDGYVYWGSLAQGEVRRINVETKEIEVCCSPTFYKGGQCRFINIALSDGTFGPRGTIFTTTGDNQTNGRPVANIPSPGVTPDGRTVTHLQQWNWHGYAASVIRGPGASALGVYPMGMGIGNGMLAVGSTGYGLDVFTLATLGEAVADQPRAHRGHKWYASHGYRVLFGNYGWSYVDAPLPWGEDPSGDCDYFLTVCGHAKQQIM